MQRRNALTLIELLVAISIMSFMIVLLLPAISRATDAAVKVDIVADKADGRYANGEPATFTIEVTRNGERVSHGRVEVQFAQDGGPGGMTSHQFDLAAGNPIQVVGSVDEPCFLLCQAWVTVDQSTCFGERMVWYRPPANPDHVEIELTPDRPDHLYHLGDQAVFTARVTQNGEPVKRGLLKLNLTRDRMRKQLGDPVAEQTFDLASSDSLRISGTLDDPTILDCQADWTDADAQARTARARCGVGFDVAHIAAQSQKPADFDAFWRQTLEQARQLPMDVEMTEMKALSTSRATYHRFSINTLGGERVYGFLGIPRGPGPFPVFAFYPGGGPGWSRPYDLGLTSRGVITLMMNVEKYPVPEDPKEARLKSKAYWADHSVKEETRETNFYYTTLPGLCRALDYVCTRDGWWDGEHLVMTGSSRGGFLALAMSSLYADRASFAVVSVPSQGDYARNHPDANAATLKRMAYYDTVHFAQSIRCPTEVVVGFVDNSCPPASVFSTYNALAGTQKRIHMAVREAHRTTPERQALERASILLGLGLR